MTDHKLERWYDHRVEAFVDGELPDNERRLFEARMAHDEALAQAVRRARRLRTELHRLPSLDCPDDLSKRVFQMTGSRSRVPAMGWALGGALGAAMVLALALGGGRYFESSDRVPATELASELDMDAAELAQARADVALALAYLDRAGQVAAREVGQQVVHRGMLQPMAAGLEQGRSLGAGQEAI